MALKSALAPLQARIFAILDGDATLDTLLGNGKIFDHVPAATVFPYVCFVEFVETPDDTMGQTGRKITATIDVYSQAEGYLQIQGIVDQVATLLDDDDITGVTGWKVQNSIYADGTLTREIDGLTRHASLTFEMEVHT